jgi:hypothetical protein
MSDHDPRIAVGVYQDRRHAHLAVERLAAAGFCADDIGFVMPEGDPLVEPPPMPQESKAAEQAATGAAAGGALGGLLGAALATAIPGVGPVIAGGLLVGALTGATGGGILGALLGLRVPEEHARQFERHFHSGRTIVTVRAGGRYDEAMKILHEAAEVPEITESLPPHRRLSDNDVSPGSGSVFPGGT